MSTPYHTYELGFFAPPSRVKYMRLVMRSEDHSIIRGFELIENITAFFFINNTNFKCIRNRETFHQIKGVQ